MEYFNSFKKGIESNERYLEKNDYKFNFGDKLTEKILKEKRKIYDNNNNFLFEIDDNILSIYDKKGILFEKKSSKEENGLFIEFGKEINFKTNSIFEGEFLNKIKWNGSIRKYNDLSLEERKNVHFLNIKRKNILIFEGKYIKGEIRGKIKEYNKDGYLIFDGEISNGNKKGKMKIFNDLGYLLFEGESLNDKKNGMGKEFNNYGKLLYDGEYLNGRKNGKGKEYDGIKKIIFEGEYLN